MRQEANYEWSLVSEVKEKENYKKESKVKKIKERETRTL